jgi:hypothetical protein
MNNNPTYLKYSITTLLSLCTIGHIFSGDSGDRTEHAKKTLKEILISDKYKTDTDEESLISSTTTNREGSWGNAYYDEKKEIKYFFTNDDNVLINFDLYEITNRKTISQTKTDQQLSPVKFLDYTPEKCSDVYDNTKITYTLPGEAVRCVATSEKDGTTTIDYEVISCYPTLAPKDIKQFMQVRARVKFEELQAEFPNYTQCSLKIPEKNKEKQIIEIIKKRNTREKWGLGIAAVGGLVFAGLLRDTSCSGCTSVNDRPMQITACIGVVATVGLATYLYNRYCGSYEEKPFHTKQLLYDSKVVNKGKTKEERIDLARAGLTYLNYVDDQSSTMCGLFSSPAPKEKRIANFCNIIRKEKESL